MQSSDWAIGSTGLLIESRDMTSEEYIEAELIRRAEELSVRPTLLAAYLIDVYSHSVSKGYVRSSE